MKVAFLNCTDELNPEAGSELTCVFLDKDLSRRNLLRILIITISLSKPLTLPLRFSA